MWWWLLLFRREPRQGSKCTGRRLQNPFRRPLGEQLPVQSQAQLTRPFHLFFVESHATSTHASALFCPLIVFARVTRSQRMSCERTWKSTDQCDRCVSESVCVWDGGNGEAMVQRGGNTAQMHLLSCALFPCSDLRPLSFAHRLASGVDCAGQGHGKAAWLRVCRV